MRRIALLVLAALTGISLFLLTSASSNTELSESAYPYLIAFNGVLIVILAGFVLLQCRTLWREYRRKKFGSRLKYRLLLMFALMALIPGVVLYSVSLQFIARSISTWFDVRVDNALEGGIALGQTAMDYLADQLEAKAKDMALELEKEENIRPATLNRLRETAQVASATLIAPNGQVQATASASAAPTTLLPELPSTAEQRRGRQGQTEVLFYETQDGLMLRTMVPVAGRSLIGEPSLLLLTQEVPENLVVHAEAVQEAYRNYQQLTLGRTGLNRIYTLTLTLTMLLAILLAFAVAFFLSRRLAKPLLILEEGTHAVAQGDFRQRRTLPARDELGILTQSFNQMTLQLEEARKLTEKSQLAVEASRAYLESILANLSAGVLAFSEEGHLRTFNQGAEIILGEKPGDLENIPLADWPALHGFRDAILDGFANHAGDWYCQTELAREGLQTLTVMIRGSALPDGQGRVVVFDDISDLVAAQRTAAWAEVARRLAHEIKNPLTPIQLSAERLAFKLGEHLDTDAARAMLEKSTQTIVNQVEAMKNLVNAFRDYARLPVLTLSALDLNELVREVLELYENAASRITVDLGENLPPVKGDATQIRQIVHNLLQNAQEATESCDEIEIIIKTHRDGSNVVMVFQDNGPGFPADILARAFEPYATTKPRGTGLGLAIVKKIVDEHDGEVWLANRGEGGAEVGVRLRIMPVSR